VSTAREALFVRRLVRAGRIPAGAVDEARAAVRTDGGSLVERLIALGHLGEDAVEDALIAEAIRARRVTLAIAGGAAVAVLALTAGLVLDAVLPPNATVTAGAFTGHYEAIGEVRAAEEREVAATVLGRIVEITVAEGQAVTEGAALVRLDADLAERTLELARARLATARAERDHLAGPALAAAEAATEAKRQAVAALTARGGADRSLAEAELRSAGAALAALRSEATTRADAARDAAAEVAFAEDDFAEMTIRAPIAGTVVRRYLRPGEVAAPGMPILRVADTARRVIEVPVPEGIAAALEARAEVRLEPESGAGPRTMR
jgi:multidrug efflux pump subunit AcrA (membrane-fusion protein)